MGVNAEASRHGPRRLLQYSHALWDMGRPLFLAGTLPLYLLGIAAAFHHGYPIRLNTALLGVVLLWLIQLTTHYNNEYFDLETDLATKMPTRISGGSRALVRGLAPRKAARIAAVTCLLLATGLAIALVAVPGVGKPVLAFIGAGLAIGWFYSGPPVKLVARGLGEASIVTASCLLLPFMAYYIQSGALSLSLLFACIPPAILTFSVILASELPDIDADRLTGKMTVVARLGTNRAVRLHATLLVLGWLLSIPLSAHLWASWGWLATLAGAPLVIVGLTGAKASAEGQTAAMERTGLATSLVLGYSTLVLAAMFLAA